MTTEALPEVQTTRTAVAPIDNGKPALYNPAAFAQIWRAAQMFASSDLVPTAYKSKPENCFIAIEMADRMGISPFAMLQSLVIIQGKPSMEAKLIIALVNDSGLFVDPLEFEVVGDDPYAKNFKVRAFATMKKSGKVCLGPWITYQMVEGEGWLGKQGSKWKTMPDLMFRYRAASYFAKLYAPNITMGMQTREEMEDVDPINITPEKKDAPALVDATPIDAKPATTDAPPLAAVTVETVDKQTGEVMETSIATEHQPAQPPGRERGKPSPGKQRRTAAEVEEDRLTDEADAKAAHPVNQTAEIMRDSAPPTPSTVSDEGWADPPGTVVTQAEEPPHTAATEVDDGEPMGDLF